MLPQSFSLSGSRCSAIGDPALREEVQSHTADGTATSRVLRSIERFGGDPSILRFEMTPKQNGVTRFGGGISWVVRAVRSDSPPVPQVPLA